MKFYIVTPSYNQIEWLRLCVASVADQVLNTNQQPLAKSDGSNTISSLQVHHHIQDACSKDGTQEFLSEHLVNSQKLEAKGYSFSFSSQKDEGMYDAINKGWKLAPDDVDVIAHLNCDEQYLPNALKIIAEFMTAQPEADVVLADMIVVDSSGEYICHRRSVRPNRFLSRFCCAGMTATTFQRASVTNEKQVFFDTSWKNFGDKVWYNELQAAGCRFAVCNQLTSVFTDTGDNLNWTKEGTRERRRYEEEFLRGSRVGIRLVSRWLGLRRLLKERFIKPPVSYALYREEGVERELLAITDPTGLWHKKWPR